MKVKINRNATKFLKSELEKENAQGKMFRVFVTEMHGNHAHYDLMLDTPNEHDEIVKTDKEIDILLDKREEFLDGVWIQYFHFPKEELIITNPSKGYPTHNH
ncbi:iron-sulfur cluster assembly accessory protein [Bacillus suaedaesalsae]|uniref:Iron-sulfur cluster assembly accessory protein n=1 Tax=Bacillus suaedaesalsae TaxID=2810349 RepID=A0ABS2DMI8_9BACI|nr:iron-sulfur cluster assembly accessory protein [Bacillus suaedaesalsae]MBM6619621.1 iron-sulfur cluster assembly accessory protein [Bacillus suaedaesalsae]